MHYNEITLLAAFVIIGLATFGLRVIFLFYQPKWMSNKSIRKGLESIPQSLLVALVVPYTLFTNGQFKPNRVDVLATILTIPIIWISKRPGLSLLVGLSLLFGLNYLF